MIRRAAACCIALLAGGCASLPPVADVASWAARKAELQSLDAWELAGRVAVATETEGFSGGLAWRQDGARAEIELRGPLGGKALAIQVDGAAISVTDGNGVSVDGDAARGLVAAELGAPLPVGELRYWLIGAPAPGAPHEESVGADGRLESLEQAGWRVRYARYESVGELALPARVDMVSDGVRLRIVVADWQMAR